jgi:hypothetical protein
MYLKAMIWWDYTESEICDRASTRCAGMPSMVPTLSLPKKLFDA